MTKAASRQQLHKPLADRVNGQRVLVHFNPQALSALATDADGYADAVRDGLLVRLVRFPSGHPGFQGIQLRGPVRLASPC